MQEKTIRRYTWRKPWQPEENRFLISSNQHTCLIFFREKNEEGEEQRLFRNDTMQLDVDGMFLRKGNIVFLLTPFNRS